MARIVSKHVKASEEFEDDGYARLQRMLNREWQDLVLKAVRSKPKPINFDFEHSHLEEWHQPEPISLKELFERHDTRHDKSQTP